MNHFWHPGIFCGSLSLCAVWLSVFVHDSTVVEKQKSRISFEVNLNYSSSINNCGLLCFIVSFRFDLFLFETLLLFKCLTQKKRGAFQ